MSSLNAANLVKVESDGVHELAGVGIVLALQLGSVDSESKILGHDARDIDSVHTGLLEVKRELEQLGIVVQASTVGQTASPGKDRSDGVGRGLAALLVLTVVAGDGSMSSLRLHGLAVGGDQD